MGDKDDNLVGSIEIRRRPDGALEISTNTQFDIRVGRALKDCLPQIVYIIGEHIKNSREPLIYED